MGKLSIKQKTILCYLVLALMFMLTGNSNNNPDPFIQRIFKPIKGENWAFYYAGLIVIIGTCYCLKYLNQIRENSFIRTTFRRIVMTLMLMDVSSNIWGFGNQIYKGFYNDLNAIYLNREKTSVQLEGNEQVINLDGVIVIKNQSHEIQTFQIKIKTPSFLRDLIQEEYILLENEVTLYPKSIDNLYLNEEINISNKGQEQSSYTTHAYEYILFNEQNEVVFKGNATDYYLD